MKYKLFEGDTENVAYASTHDESREVMKKLLARRGLLNKEDIEGFLTPNYELSVRDPFEIKDMEKAAKRIVDALRNCEKFCIYSDYDCDGIPGGTVLSDFFDHIGYTNRVHYIPHRHKEGYGLNKGAIDKLVLEGVRLMITVDSGITNVEEVAYAEGKGINVILTDHHLPLREEVREKDIKNGKLGKQILPKAFAVINSKRDDCEYHDDMLCGCAVAWKLSCAILSLLREDKIAHDNFQEVSSKKQDIRKGVNKKIKPQEKFSPEYGAILEKVKNTKEGWEKWWLDLVAISTIADMVPLVKENRALAYFGMKVLQKSSRAGLQKLLALSKSKQAKLTAMDIAFTIAPRVNAASRMSEPIVAYHMLRGNTSFAPLAISSAEDLESLNQIRKDTVKGIKKEVMGYDLDIHTHVVVIGNESWGPGVLGLIAQEVFDETGKPTFVWGMGEQENEYKGSCRAPEHVDLVALMSASLAGTFLGFGGHAQAGGFSVERKNVEALAEALNDAYLKLELSHEVPEEEVIIDALLSFDIVSSKFHKELEKLEPCGEGNPKPTFAFQSDGALSVREFGKQGGHYEVLYERGDGRVKNEESGRAREAIGFARQEETVKAIYFFGEAEKLALLTEKHTLIAQLEESHFGWKPELRLRVVDVVKEI